MLSLLDRILLLEHRQRTTRDSNSLKQMRTQSTAELHQVLLLLLQSSELQSLHRSAKFLITNTPLEVLYPTAKVSLPEPISNTTTFLSIKALYIIKKY